MDWTPGEQRALEAQREIWRAGNDLDVLSEQQRHGVLFARWLRESGRISELLDDIDPPCAPRVSSWPRRCSLGREWPGLLS